MQPINLLPTVRERRQERLRLNLPKRLFAFGILWLVLLGAVYGWFFISNRDLKEEKAQLELQVAELDAYAERMAQLEALQLSVDRLQVELDAATAVHVLPAIEALSKLMPFEIATLQVQYEQGRITMNCMSIGLAPIGRFYSNMQAEAAFSEVEFGAVSGGSGGTAGDIQYSFTVSCVYREEGGHDR